MIVILFNDSGKDLYFQSGIMRREFEDSVRAVRFVSGDADDAFCWAKGRQMVIGDHEELKQVEDELQELGFTREG